MMMKRKVISILLVLLLAGFLQTDNALAGNVFKFKGKSAEAFFFNEENCVSTFVDVFATKGQSQSPPGPWTRGTEAFVFIDQFDFCTETPLLSASGSALLDDSAFQINREISSASLSATINVWDYVSETSLDVVVNMAWTGTGDLSRENSHFHFSSPGCRFNGRFKGAFRPGEASGSVSIGGTNFTPDPTSSAFLTSTSNGSVEIGCGF